MTTDDFEGYDDYDDSPVLTEAEVRYYDRLGEARNAQVKGESFDTTLARLGYCADLVEIPTEDGPSTGRCLGDAVGDTGSCEGHLSERMAWQSMSELEKAHWEREQDAGR